MTKERYEQYMKIGEEAMENGWDDQDFFEELADAGFTLEEFKGTPFYEMVKRYTETHAWERAEHTYYVTVGYSGKYGIEVEAKTAWIAMEKAKDMIYELLEDLDNCHLKIEALEATDNVDEAFKELDK